MKGFFWFFLFSSEFPAGFGGGMFNQLQTTVWTGLQNCGRRERLFGRWHVRIGPIPPHVSLSGQLFSFLLFLWFRAGGIIIQNGNGKIRMRSTLETRLDNVAREVWSLLFTLLGRGKHTKSFFCFVFSEFAKNSQPIIRRQSQPEI